LLQAYIDESNDAEGSTGESPMETKEEPDSEQDTNMYEDSRDSQYKGNHVELRDTEEEYHDVDSYAHEEYVIEESSDTHAEDDDENDDDDDNETSVVKSELAENLSHSEVREMQIV
jgi:hypothetical protein